jgi:hypothetical protein
MYIYRTVNMKYMVCFYIRSLRPLSLNQYFQRRISQQIWPKISHVYVHVPVVEM